MRAGFEDVRVAQQSGAVEDAGDHQARAFEVGGEIGAHGVRSGQVLGVGMRGGSRVGKFQDGGPQGSLDVDGVNLVALERAVEVEGAAGARAGDDGDVGAFVVFLAEVRPGAEAPPPSAPKLGKVTMLLPPCTETPGRGGLPVVPVPAPPEPG